MNGSKTSRLSNLNGVQFVNEKEKTLQEIKKRKVMKEEAERKINVDMMRSCIIPLEIKKEKWLLFSNYQRYNGFNRFTGFGFSVYRVSYFIII